MAIVDANVVLRYLLDDHPELSVKAAEILEQHTVTLTAIKLSQILPLLTKEGTRGWYLTNRIRTTFLTAPDPSLRRRGEIVLNLMALR